MFDHRERAANLKLDLGFYFDHAEQTAGSVVTRRISKQVRARYAPATMAVQPRRIALCVIWRGTRILVGEGYDRVKGQRFYRPLGGAIEAGESAEEAAVRELREELGVDIKVTGHLATMEYRFVYEDKPGWEITELIEAAFMSAIAPEATHVPEEGWAVKWIDPGALDAPLYPTGLTELLLDARLS